MDDRVGDRMSGAETVEYELRLWVIIGFPLLGLFLIRGYGATFKDGEALLFSATLLLAVLYDYLADTSRPFNGVGEVWSRISSSKDFDVFVAGVAFLGLNVYYLVGDHIVRWDWVHVLWFWIIIAIANSLVIARGTSPDRKPLLSRSSGGTAGET